MKIWVNAQLSPAIADWIAKTFAVEAIAVRELGLRDATDKDIWLTCGNTSNSRLRDILSKTLPQALELLASGEKIVEIKDT